MQDAIVTRLGAIRHPDASTVRRVVWAMLPCVLAVWFAWRYTATFSEPSSYYPPFTDAVTYLAAGERLNAGHPLYSLAAGDRRVALEPTLSPAAILSPPPIAVICSRAGSTTSSYSTGDFSTSRSGSTRKCSTAGCAHFLTACTASRAWCATPRGPSARK